MCDFMEISRRYLFGPLCFAAMGLAQAEDAATSASGASATAGTTASAGAAASTTASGATGTPPAASSNTASGGETRFVSRIENSFGALAGSPANAESLALGLRRGETVTLSSGASAGQTSTVTFTPPTRPMGHGNVVHALSLAQAQLAAQGITQPTPEQLKVALMGGTLASGSGTTAQTTDFQGVLQLRAQGMGWGQIAHALGVKPGRATLNATATTGAATASGSGTVTAAGDRTRVRQEFRREDGEGRHRFEHRFERRVDGQASRSGIVTAAGDRTRVRQEFRHEARADEHRVEHRFEQRVEAPAPNRGIVTAVGTPAGGMIMHGRGHGDQASAAVRGSSSAVVTAGGAGSGRGGQGGGRSGGRGRD